MLVELFGRIGGESQQMKPGMARKCVAVLFDEWVAGLLMDGENFHVAALQHDALVGKTHEYIGLSGTCGIRLRCIGCELETELFHG